jgi:hypothetical protein
MIKIWLRNKQFQLALLEKDAASRHKELRFRRAFLCPVLIDAARQHLLHRAIENMPGF